MILFFTTFSILIVQQCTVFFIIDWTHTSTIYCVVTWWK